jgi:DNA segregation ATPase FtsK/SpoIIIE-like protein
MVRRKNALWLSKTTQTMGVWFLLIFAAILVFFAQKEYLEQALSPLFWPYFRWFFSPISCLVWAHMVFGKSAFDMRRGLGLLFFWISSVSLWSYFDGSKRFFFDVHDPLIVWFDKIPALTLLFGFLFFSLYLLFHVSYRKIISQFGEAGWYAYRKQIEMLNTFSDSIRERQEEKRQLSPKEEKRLRSRNEELESKIEKLSSRKPSDKQNDHNEGQSFFEKLRNKWLVLETKPVINQSLLSKTGVATRSVPIVTKNVSIDKHGDIKPFQGSWQYPRSDLLMYHPKWKPLTREEIELQSAIIERTLLQFGIEVSMAGFEVGPTVTQYRLKPSEGVKLNKIEALKKDLTLALKAKNIRIQAPIPGLGLVGIEVPNDRRDVVSLREIVESPAFSKHTSKLAMCVGSGIAGDPVVCDMKDMPHLLIAGQTGSGKSVGMNGFLISLLLRNSPAELRMIMVDPKRVELWVYNGIPHLLAPVINHPDKALNALKWCVAEMIRRYDLLTEVRARNLAEYNAKVKKEEKMPAIVIVIDELADLMMSGNKKEVENAIARIAQMARAVGMHLIVATQRPSVDVITGLIKANIPSRIAFTVASQVDSRTILDRVGAEDLLGRWDMLYAPSGVMEPERVQGVFVKTEEVEAIIHFIKMHTDADTAANMYDMTIVEGQKHDGPGDINGDGNADQEDDFIIQQAIEVVRSSGKASTSLLQRRLKLGYARAARVMDALEEMGVIGPADGSKPREVY